MKKKKKDTHIQFSPVAVVLLQKLREKTGLKTTYIIELAIRKLAQLEGIELPKDGQDDSGSEEVGK